MPRYFWILHIFIATLVFTCFSHAYATEDDAGIFVKNLGNNAISLLTEKGIADKERETRFRALFRANFDVDSYLQLNHPLIICTPSRRTSND